jgi:hypothetical protein
MTVSVMAICSAIDTGKIVLDRKTSIVWTLSWNGALKTDGATSTLSSAADCSWIVTAKVCADEVVSVPVALSEIVVGRIRKPTSESEPVADSSITVGKVINPTLASVIVAESEKGALKVDAATRVESVTRTKS